MAEVLLNGCYGQTHNIVDSANKMPLKHHDRKYHVHCFLALGKNKPRSKQQHDVLFPFNGMARRCCNSCPSYLMSLNFLDQIVDSRVLHRIPLFLYLIPRNALSRHVSRNCLFMVFYGRGAALLWQIVLTRLRSAVGLVCQVPIDVDIGDWCKLFLGEPLGLIVLRFVEE